MSGSGTSAFVFAYTVQAGDADDNGIALGAITLGSSYIRDAAGNDANLTLTLTDTSGVKVDAAAPAAPSITGISEDTGTSAADGITRDTTPTLSGTAEAGSTVTIYRDATAVGTTTADTSGDWSYTVSTLTEGSYVFTATATDSAGNVGVASASFGVNIDVTAPTVSGIADGAIYNESEAATFTEGSAAVVKDGGAPSAYISGAEISDEGSYALTLTDIAGNSVTVNFTIDLTDPLVLSVGIPASGTYKTGDTLSFTVNFSETVTTDPSVKPTLSLTIGSSSTAAVLLLRTRMSAPPHYSM
jgi:hypothetical protein